MSRIRFFGMTFIVVAMAVFALAGCGGGDGNNNTPGGNGGGGGGGGSSNNVAAAFRQFGVDLEQVKPNVATPDDAINQNRSNVSSSVYTARAYYRERSNAAISNAVAVEYKERLFNYIKTISADNKCYRVRLSLSEAPVEVATFSDLLNVTGAYDSWSYRHNGWWVNVGTLHYSLGDEIGLDLLGFATY